jgi:hypothetical protein
VIAVHLTQDLADEFAVGALAPDDESAVRLHCAGCADCDALVRDAERVAAAMAIGLPLVPAPATMRDRVLGANHGARSRSFVRTLGFSRAAAGVAAVVVAAAAFAGMLSVRGQVGELRRENSTLKSQIDDALSARVEVAALTRRLSDEERNSASQGQKARSDQELLLAMLSPKSDAAEVYSTDEQGTSIGRLIWSEEQKRVWFVADNLAARPNGETYQLWVSEDGTYESLGTFVPDASGFACYVATVPEGMKGYDAAVVTIEQAGGAAERSGPSVFAADLSRFRH